MNEHRLAKDGRPTLCHVEGLESVVMTRCKAQILEEEISLDREDDDVDGDGKDCACVGSVQGFDQHTTRNGRL